MHQHGDVGGVAQASDQEPMVTCTKKFIHVCTHVVLYESTTTSNVNICTITYI